MGSREWGAEGDEGDEGVWGVWGDGGVWGEREFILPTPPTLAMPHAQCPLTNMTTIEFVW
ncbi:hypothetical protein FACHB389_00640 [Nostoc calcicola FACHB-389]|nr:hypothetical protein FACHB389_00640 [Nostoc calcicola FACHB-389]